MLKEVAGKEPIETIGYAQQAIESGGIFVHTKQASALFADLPIEVSGLFVTVGWQALEIYNITDNEDLDKKPEESEYRILEVSEFGSEFKKKLKVKR